jgi:hypothetical protein
MEQICLIYEKFVLKDYLSFLSPYTHRGELLKNNNYLLINYYYLKTFSQEELVFAIVLESECYKI